jgi:NAD(P) transhydrogenase subunit alpha
MFPMLMTAAGTVTAARVFVIGAGVAGCRPSPRRASWGGGRSLRRAPAVKEQIQSLGAKFVELPLETASAEGAAATPRRRTRTSTASSAR